MIYANNNGIIPMNEGLLDRLFKRKNNKKIKNNENDKIENRIKNNQNNDNANNRKMKTEFDRKELNEIFKNDEKLVEDSYNNLSKVLKKIIDKSNVSKAFKIVPMYDMYTEKVIYDNYYGLDCEFPIMLNNIVSVDITEVISNEGNYKSDPNYKEVEKVCEKLINSIKSYFSGKITPCVFLDGDWDTFLIVMAHPVSDFGFELNKDLNESTIFKYANL